MAKLFISRLLETFFRRKWLFLLPIVPFLALGVFNVATKESSYRSTGVMQVNADTLLNPPNSTGNPNRFGGETPAVYTAGQINDRLQVEAFLDEVISAANLDDAIASGAITRNDVRRSISATAPSDEFVAVNATTWQADLSYQLAQATINSFFDWEAKNISDQSEQAAASLRVQRDQAKLALDSAAGDALDAAQAQFDDLTAQYNRATLATSQAPAIVAQQYEVLDEPTEGVLESSRKQDLITLIMYLVLGGFVSAVALVAATLMDRSVRYSEEIEIRLDVPVVATIPESTAAIAPRVL